jgi:hypothetical protein
MNLQPADSRFLCERTIGHERNDEDQLDLLIDRVVLDWKEKDKANSSLESMSNSNIVCAMTFDRTMYQFNHHLVIS